MFYIFASDKMGNCVELLQKTRHPTQKSKQREMFNFKYII